VLQLEKSKQEMNGKLVCIILKQSQLE